jgi:ferredoxin-type protein NapF
MTCAVSRRQFLRGNVTGRSTALRPPWAMGENDFVSRCDQCAECISACPSRLIEADNDGFPRINFLKGECDFCTACARACGTGALAYRDNPEQVIWSLAASIEAECIAYQGVVCRICGENCEAAAVQFVPVVGRGLLPRVEVERCTGCGACISVCPVKAIRMGPAENGRRIYNENVLREMNV